jgi:hypothetical protein
MNMMGGPGLIELFIVGLLGLGCLGGLVVIVVLVTRGSGSREVVQTCPYCGTHIRGQPVRQCPTCGAALGGPPD